MASDPLSEASSSSQALLTSADLCPLLLPPPQRLSLGHGLTKSQDESGCSSELCLPS